MVHHKRARTKNERKSRNLVKCILLYSKYVLYTLCMSMKKQDVIHISNQFQFNVNLQSFVLAIYCHFLN